MRSVIARIGNVVVESWSPDAPGNALSDKTKRRGWAGRRWARPGRGRLPDPWQRAAGRRRLGPDRDEASHV